MRSESTPAFVLRLVAYGEADRIVELFTARRGRLAALARGARRSRRRFGGVLDYFLRLNVRIRPGRGDLWHLEEAVLARAYPGVLRSLEAHGCAAHVLEVVRMGTREGAPEPELFGLVGTVFDALDRGADPESLRRVFQIRALSALGYGLPADACRECGRVLGETGAAFHAGTLVCRHCAPPGAPGLSAGAVRTIGTAAGAAVERLARLRIPRALERELGPVLDQAVCTALGTRPRTLGPSYPGGSAIDRAGGI